jgi:branched-chain amino acid transport system ATP-binding protein
MAILTTKRLTKQFGGLVAIDKLDLAVKESSIHSVIGPNGAGKTTLFNCITGFYKPELGEIDLMGHALVGLLPDQGKST